MEWQISDQDIQAVEELLLPHGAHFPEDARKVIRWLTLALSLTFTLSIELSIS